MGSNLYDWALIYRDMGLCPIPLCRRDDPRDPSGNKRPLFSNWQNTTMPDEAMLERWFGPNMDGRRNIGIVCGQVSGNLIVIDFDDFDAYIDWLEIADPPSTLTMNSGGGGIHCYYRVKGKVPGNHKLIGGDLRGEGGQVVAPPSVHLSGKHYDVRDASDIALVSLDALRLPYYIRRFTTQPARQAVMAAQASGDYGRIVQTLATAQEGDRNNTLLWCACRLFDQGISLPQVELTLMATALQIGLEHREIKATIANAQKQSRKANPPLPPHKLLAARLERHGTPRWSNRHPARQ
jgi:hypothetical protein